MTRRLKKQVVAYYISNTVVNASMCFIGTTYILFLRGVGLSFFEIGLINIAYNLAHMLFNVPTGVIADAIGRKAPFIIGCVIDALAMTGYFFATSFLHCLLAEIFAGVGMAFLSGSLVSHLVDNLKEGGKEKDTNKILSLGGGINTLVSMAAGTLGALAGRSNLAMPFLMSGVASFVAGIYASFYLIEPARNGLSKVNMFRETISGIKEVLNKERILLLAMILAGSSFLFQFFVKMWAPYIKPLTGSQKDFSWIWIVLMGGAFLGNCMSYVIKKDHFTVLFVSKIFLAISLPLCVISPGLLPKVMCLGMMEIAQGASGPLFNTEISQHIESARRATIMSAIGMVSSMGSMLGLLSGIFADKFGVETTWLWGGGMALVFFLYLGTRYSKSKK